MSTFGDSAKGLLAALCAAVCLGACDAPPSNQGDAGLTSDAEDTTDTAEEPVEPLDYRVELLAEDSQGQMLWADQPSGNLFFLADQFSHVSDILVSRRDARAIDSFLEDVRLLEADAFLAGSSASPYAYVRKEVEEDRLALWLIDFAEGEARLVRERLGSNPFFDFHEQTGRLVYTPDADLPEVYAFNPETGREALISDSSIQRKFFLQSGRYLYRRYGSDKVFRWDFDGGAAKEVYEAPNLSIEWEGGDRLFWFTQPHEADPDYRTVALYDDARGEVVFEKSLVRNYRYQADDDGRMVVYEQKQGRRDYLRVTLLPSGETYTITEGTLYDVKAFASERPAVAVDPRDGPVLLWDAADQTVRILPDLRDGPWPSPDGSFWAYEKSDTVDPSVSTLLEAVELNSDERFVLGPNPQVSSGACRDIYIAPGGKHVIFRSRSVNYARVSVHMWQQGTNRTATLLDRPEVWRDCSAWAISEDANRGVVASNAFGGRLVAWDGARVHTIRESREISRVWSYGDFDGVVYATKPVGATGGVSRLEHWDFDTHEITVIDENLVAERDDEDPKVVQSGDTFAYLRYPDGCSGYGCTAKLKLYRHGAPNAPLLLDDQVVEHDGAWRFEEHAGYFFWYGYHRADDRLTRYWKVAEPQ